jgi:rhamnulokinase
VSGLALAAVDLGASSGRVMLGHVGPDVLELTEVARFRNGGVRLPDGLYWDILGLYLDVLAGVRATARRAASAGSRLAGIGIDSWAVDYGLVTPDGRLLGNPRHYRDERTEAVIDDVHAKVDPSELYEVTGLQFLPFNTLYQFAAEPLLTGSLNGGGLGAQALLVPDLLGYWLTGVRAAE